MGYNLVLRGVGQRHLDVLSCRLPRLIKTFPMQRLIWLFIALFLTGVAPAFAEADDLKVTTKPAAQTVLTQEQFDALVKSVTDAVTKTLQAQSVTNTNNGKPISLSSGDDQSDSIIKALVPVFERMPTVIAAFPTMGDALIRFGDRLDRSAQGGLGFGGFVIALLAALLSAIIAEWIVRRMFRPLSLQLAEKIPNQGGLKALLGLTVIESLRLLAVIGTTHSIAAAWFAHAGFQSTVMTLAFDAWFRWRVFAVLVEIILRPTMPMARIAPVTDNSARTVAFWMIFAAAVSSATRFYSGLFSAPSILAAALMLSAFILAATYIASLYALREPLSEWFSGLVTPGSTWSKFKLMLAHHWLAIGVPLLLTLAFTRVLGALTAGVALPIASAATLNVIVGYILLETLLVYLSRRPLTDDGVQEHLRPFILRAIHVAAMIAAILYIVHIWAVTGLGLLEASRWSELIDSWRSLGLILLGGFFAWETVNFISKRYSPAANHSTMANEDSLAEPQGTTRLQTLMPPFRVASAVAIMITTLLMALSSLGINTTPLIAGASVLGLAISFGSQALVKDIVSGIFFLADDAFRVGEYIDCKSVKGTVEGFTLRSIKLRHQNGQIHTIPFGQLGQITNFSRDWTTVKFNLRFERGTDIEALRKATKKIGQALQDDPELKDQFIAPLKLQGVADIDENALIMRFKFTVKPINPGLIQRLAIKRMIADFPAQGLEFASTPGLVLQTPATFETSPASSQSDKDPNLITRNEAIAAASKSV